MLAKPDAGAVAVARQVADGDDRHLPNGSADSAAASTPLLQQGEAPPWSALRAGAASPLVLIGDHSGRAIPRSLAGLGLRPAALDRHIACDIGIASLGAALSQALGATFLAQRYSRLVIDCNRDPSVPSSIVEISEDTEIPGNRDLGEADRLARRDAIFRPYQDRIAALLDRRADQGRASALVALHSFTPIFKGVSRPWHAGILFNRDARLARPLLELLRAEDGLAVGENEPYRVTDLTDYTVPVHGERRGLPHVEIEIRQDLIADPAGQAVWAERLARLLPAAYAAFQRQALDVNR
jgi:predicted N-formylglutamate amidohydrolase